MLESRAAPRSGTRARAPDRLATWLVSFAGEGRTDPVALADALAVAARLLAARRAGDTGHDALAALLLAIGELGAGAGAHPVPLSLGAPVLAALAAEAAGATHRVRPGRDGEQLAVPAVPLLARLAVSRQLTLAVGAAVGFPVVPTRMASYLVDLPGSMVAPHIDRDGWPLTAHLVLAHEPGVGRGSPLLVFDAGRPRPRRVRIRVGQTVVIRARGTLHGWGRLGGDELRTMTAIGFAPL